MINAKHTEVPHEDPVVDHTDDEPVADMGAEAPEEVKRHEEPEVIPSWFSRTYGEKSKLDVAEDYARARPVPPAPVLVEGAASYEAYRRRLEERFANAQRLADPDYGLYADPRVSADVVFPNRPRYGAGVARAAMPPPKARRPLGFRVSTIAAMALLACGLGSGLGYVVANPSQTRVMAASLIAGLWPDSQTASVATVIEKKPMQTARLEVRDTSGAINAPIQLDIAAVPANPNTPVAFRITGLPPSAYLTKGYEISEGEWMLKAADIANAELIVPHTNTPELDLQVAALEEKTGAPAAPAKSFTVTLDTNAVPVPGVPQPKQDNPVVTPVAAQPDQGFNKLELPAAVPVPLESVNPEVQNLIVKGDTLLGNGDVLAARQFYLRAYQLKATSAAYGVGQTYDPAVFAKHNIKGLAPDVQTAAEWYGKAAASGYELASQALENLPVQP
jgi:hypothetical protein